MQKEGGAGKDILLRDREGGAVGGAVLVLSNQIEASYFLLKQTALLF